MSTDDSGAYLNRPRPDPPGDVGPPAAVREPYQPPSLTDLGAVSGETQATGGGIP
jgi:hypothetical protein